jgi:hypothetical protein
VEGGSLLELEGYHFLKGDSITGNSSWKCTNRQDAVAPYADIHYTELRPGAIPAVLYPEGGVFVTWQSIQNGQSDIRMRAFQSGSWSPEIRISESKANDWEPAIAAGRDGNVYIAWDTYDAGNYDVAFRSWHAGSIACRPHARAAVSSARGRGDRSARAAVGCLG